MSDDIKLYMDEQIPTSVTKGLRQHNIDVQTTHEAGRRGQTDEEQLAYASQEGRVVVTMDNDYLHLDRNGTPHAGIAFIQRKYQHSQHVGVVIEWLLLLTTVTKPEQMQNHVEYCFDPSED